MYMYLHVYAYAALENYVLYLLTELEQPTSKVYNNHKVQGDNLHSFGMILASLIKHYYYCYCKETIKDNIIDSIINW